MKTQPGLWGDPGVDPEDRRGEGRGPTRQADRSVSTQAKGGL